MKRIDSAIKGHQDPPERHRQFATAIFPEKPENIAIIRAHEYRRGDKTPIQYDVVSRIVAWAARFAKNRKPSRQREKTK